ncbi:MAG: hypothetical protein D6756_14080 [Cyanobacteria bacterium J083]|nr:MAG: hypothetical protein D6756_14080 [Cyanobacteria bacterium J083]
MFIQMLLNPDTTAKDNSKTNLSPHKSLQKRLQLKAKVAEVYAKLLAYLRWNLLEIANNLANNSVLFSAESIFFLELSEIRRLIRDPNWQLPEDIISRRENIIKQHQNLRSVPYIVYGFPNQVINNQPIDLINKQKDKLQFHGIGASPGKVRGKVKIIHSLQTREQIDKDTILVLPYTDAGWSPLLARAGGIISEVGGRLSHGAIVAREYKIPAVMDIAHATELLIDGQIVEIDGQQGIVKIVENSTNTSEK